MVHEVEDAITEEEIEERSALDAQALEGGKLGKHQDGGDDVVRHPTCSPTRTRECARVFLGSKEGRDGTDGAAKKAMRALVPVGRLDAHFFGQHD